MSNICYKDGYCRADTDGLMYRREDVEWIVEPDIDDSGVLGPKAKAVPVEEDVCSG